eukprot:SAG22_NODE_149_length_17456_cov_5.058363_7_plen_132_part_00
MLLLESGEPEVEAEAEQLLHAVRAIRSRADPPLYGPDSMSVVQTEDLLQGLYLRQGRQAEAQTLIEHILAIRAAELGACGATCSAVQCSAVQCSAVQSSAVQSTPVHSGAVQCSAVQCSAVQDSLSHSLSL